MEALLAFGATLVSLRLAADLARRFGLIVSGGSDYHGSYKPGLELGTGYGDLVVPDQVVDQLREAAS